MTIFGNWENLGTDVARLCGILPFLPASRQFLLLHRDQGVSLFLGKPGNGRDVPRQGAEGVPR
jgi:hypothetical protein